MVPGLPLWSFNFQIINPFIFFFNFGTSFFSNHGFFVSPIFIYGAEGVGAKQSIQVDTLASFTPVSVKVDFFLVCKNQAGAY